MKQLPEALNNLVELTQNELATLEQSYDEAILYNNWASKGVLDNLNLRAKENLLSQMDYHSITGYDCGIVYLIINDKDTVAEINKWYTDYQNSTFEDGVYENIIDFFNMYDLQVIHNAVYLNPQWNINLQSMTVQSIGLSKIADDWKYGKLFKSID